MYNKKIHTSFYLLDQYVSSCRTNYVAMIVIMWMQIGSNSVSFVDSVLSYDKAAFRH